MTSKAGLCGSGSGESVNIHFGVARSRLEESVNTLFGVSRLGCGSRGPIGVNTLWLKVGLYNIVLW